VSLNLPAFLMVDFHLLLSRLWEKLVLTGPVTLCVGLQLLTTFRSFRQSEGDLLLRILRLATYELPFFMNLVFWTCTALAGTLSSSSYTDRGNFHRSSVASFSLGLFVFVDSTRFIFEHLEGSIFQKRRLARPVQPANDPHAVYIHLACIAVCLVYIFTSFWKKWGVLSSDVTFVNFFTALIVIYVNRISVELTCTAQQANSVEFFAGCELATKRVLLHGMISAILGFAVMWFNMLPILMVVPSKRTTRLEIAIKRVAALPGCRRIISALLWRNLEGHWEAAVSMAVCDELSQHLVASLARGCMKSCADDVTSMAVLERENAVPVRESRQTCERSFGTEHFLDIEQAKSIPTASTCLMHNHAE